MKAEGKNPFTLSSKPGDGSYQSFLANGTRYSSLARKFPDRAKDFFAKSEAALKKRFKHLQNLLELHKTAFYNSTVAAGTRRQGMGNGDTRLSRRLSRSLHDVARDGTIGENWR